MKEKPIIYQLLVRLAGNSVRSDKPWGTIEENGCGKFNDITDHFLHEIKKLGISHIWLTGVIEHASCTAYPENGIPADNPLAVKGRAGSPYAIRDYYDVSPDLAVDIDKRMEEFESLIKRCHDAGLAPVIDFVPNHVARHYRSDHPGGASNGLGYGDDTRKAFDPANNFYYIPGHALEMPPETFQLPPSREAGVDRFNENPAKATGNDCFTHRPAFTDWYETVKLNYGIDYQNNHAAHFDPIPNTWYKMLDILKFWAGKQIAGFRCDMAEMVPVAFWQWAIGQLKNQHPKLLFIAEIYNPGLYTRYSDAGFDFLYDKVGLYDAIRDVLSGKRHASSFTQEWQKLSGLDARMLRFIENHDEQRIASDHFAGTALAGIPSMTLAATMHQGPAMIYFGQEVGEKAEGASGFSGDDGRTSIFDYCHVPAFQQWYNNGDCNEKHLDERSRNMRSFYKKLFTLTKHAVISQGNFYDLMWANNSGNNAGLYTYLRWDKETTWLIVLNFSNQKPVECKICIPQHFWNISRKTSKETNWKISPILNNGIAMHYLQDELITHGFGCFLPTLSAEIFSVTPSTSMIPL